MSQLPQRLVAEALGTGFLLMGVVGSGIMAERLTDDVALALLANTMATGAILVVLIAGLGPVSGAHLNPAVTMAMTLRNHLSKSDALAYIAVQAVAAVIGVWLAHLMFDVEMLQASEHIRTGPPQALSEGIATFGLVFFIFLGLRFRPDGVAWMVGLYIVAAYWFTASTSFANPAVTLGRMFTDSFSGIRPVDAPVFVFAQILGAGLATLTARLLDRNVSE